MKRRDFFKTLGAATASVAFCNGMSAAEISGKKLPSIGLIPSNTAGEWFKQDPKAALEKIAGLGYKELEFGGDLELGMDAARVNKYLKSLGLRPVIGPTSMAAMTDTVKLQADIKACRELARNILYVTGRGLLTDKVVNWTIGNGWQKT